METQTCDQCIRLENVFEAYEGKEILSDFNLAIRKGEFLTVIGSSGCGKTTVLKLINGLIRPDSGRITINGRDLSDIDLIQLRRNIGYVIQEVGLFPHMTVARNISYVPDLIGKETKEESREMKCSVCGSDNLDGSAYCEDCGARLPVGGAAPAASNPPPAPASPTPPASEEAEPPPESSGEGGVLVCASCGNK